MWRVLCETVCYLGSISATKWVGLEGSVPQAAVDSCYKARFSGPVLPLLIHLQNPPRIEPGFIYLPL